MRGGDSAATAGEGSPADGWLVAAAPPSRCLVAHPFPPLLLRIVCTRRAAALFSGMVMRAAAWRLCVAATGDAARWPALCRSPSPLPPPPPLLPLLSGARLFADKPAAPAAKKAAPAAAAAPKSKRAGTPLERRPKVWNKEVIDISGPKSGGKLVATGRVTAVVGAVVDVQFDKVG